jgi:hypothetical protein
MKPIIKVLIASGLLALFSTLKADVADPECEAEKVAPSGAVGSVKPCNKAELTNESSEMAGEGNALTSEDTQKDKKKKKKNKKHKDAQDDDGKQDEKDRKD